MSGIIAFMNTDLFSQYEPIPYLLTHAEKTDIPLVYVNKQPELDPSLPTLFVVSSPGGGGKNAISDPLIKEGVLFQSRTATTRARRVHEGEAEDKYIWMRSKQENETDEEYWQHLISEYELVEHMHFNGFFYGIPFPELQNTMAKGPTVLLIEPHGVVVLREALKGKANLIVIFIVPESYAQLWERMKLRENPEQRLQISVKEIKEAPQNADFYLFNPLEYNGQPGLPQAQESLRQLVLRYSNLHKK